MESPTKPKTTVYIDGFNFYHGALKGTRYRWIDLQKLSEILLPNHEVQKVNYYTALLHRRPGNATAPRDQKLYFRALRTLPSVEIILGLFRTHEVSMLQSRASGKAWVWKTEEKGSDVNIGNDMIRDACFGRYECAVLISNDSDLARTIDTVSLDFGLTVGVVNPFTKKPTSTLVKNASFKRTIRSKAVLKRAQFPYQMKDLKGAFHKPHGW